MPKVNAISPCLWFDSRAEEAASFYIGIFPDSRISHVARYLDAGKEKHGKPPGSVMFVDFELVGQRFGALNGGPQFKLSPAISMMVHCESQDEIDRYWEHLSEDGAPEAQTCGWLADKFGLSWQIVPAGMASFFRGGDTERAGRVMTAMMAMKKLDIAALQRAAAG
jgi:predicted 3-demethylubiquinone-9 3-methyltransferase (glyoxalase superfamily)